MKIKMEIQIHLWTIEVKKPTKFLKIKIKKNKILKRGMTLILPEFKELEHGLCVRTYPRRRAAKHLH